jgi:hypothetical protein
VAVAAGAAAVVAEQVAAADRAAAAGGVVAEGAAAADLNARLPLDKVHDGLRDLAVHSLIEDVVMRAASVAPATINVLFNTGPAYSAS